MLNERQFSTALSFLTLPRYTHKENWPSGTIFYSSGWVTKSRAEITAHMHTAEKELAASCIGKGTVTGQ